MRARTGRLRRLMVSNDDFDGLGVEFEQRALRDHGADRALDIALRQVVALGRLRIQRLQHARARRRSRRAIRRW